jgi:hypothetical protein
MLLLWGPPSFLFKGCLGLFPLRYSSGGWDVKLTTHLHLGPRFRMSGVMPPLCHVPSWTVQTQKTGILGGGYWDSVHSLVIQSERKLRHLSCLVVTSFTARCVVLPTECIVVSCTDLRRGEAAVLPLHDVRWLVFINGTDCAYFAVRTWYK